MARRVLLRLHPLNLVELYYLDVVLHENFPWNQASWTEASLTKALELAVLALTLSTGSPSFCLARLIKRRCSPSRTGAQSCGEVTWVKIGLSNH